MSNIITQVSQDAGPSVSDAAAAAAVQDEDDYNAIINLNVRGVPFRITRDELMSLPESILLCLFPTGVFLDENGQVITNLTEHDVVYVDFSPECYKYIVDTFSNAAASMPSNEDNVDDNNNSTADSELRISDPYVLDSNILKTKPAVIVLREDLDFYCIPPMTGLNQTQMKRIKAAVAKELVSHVKIFEGLGYKPNRKQLGPAEQHLLDMLCSAGFSTADNWGHREVETNKSVISSLSLVQLKPDSGSSNRNGSFMSSPGSPGSSITSNTNDYNSKLLLFWKKPARKCWWSNEALETVVFDLLDNEKASKIKVKVHIRRVWTLELAVLRLRLLGN